MRRLAVLLCLAVGCHQPETSALDQPDVRPSPGRVWNVDSAAATAGPCEVTPDSVRTPAGARLTAGDYLLVAHGVEGIWAGRVVRGRLWLAPAHGTDRSPRTGRGPAEAGDTVESPLLGATDVALDSVGAPVMLDDTIAPLPTSRDPVRPGVRVHRAGWDDPGGSPQWVLTVGTLSNLRDQTGWLDGAGIGMWVRRLTANGFAGTWSEWGIVRGGRGYFCATRVGG